MKRIVNRKARFNYELLETVEAGVVLTGAEVKSAKLGQVSLKEAFCRVDDNQELWLHNAHIHPYKFSRNEDYETTRTRKLLLKKREILSLAKQVEGKKLNLIPTAMYTKKGRVKVEVALARSKKQWDKRRVIKEREQKRKARQVLKQMV